MNAGLEPCEKVLIDEIAKLGLSDKDDSDPEDEDGEPIWQMLDPSSPALG